jgi:hypothetical protein
VVPKAVENEIRDENEVEVEVEVENEVELEVEGTLKSLSPLVVSANGRDFTCAVPNGVSLAGFATGDFVEMECESVRGIQTLRELELEDEDDVGERAEATTTAARATPATTTAARVATEAVTAVGTTTSPGALP